MLQLSAAGFAVVVIFLIWIMIVIALEIRKVRKFEEPPYLPYSQHELKILEAWHQDVLMDETQGNRRVGERFESEGDLIHYESVRRDSYWFD